MTPVTDISKLSKNFPRSLPNAKMLASNPSYVIYAFKEGSIRVINQNAKEHFRLSNSSKVPIVDLALTPDATVDAAAGNVLLCLDENGHVSIFELDVLPGDTGTERTRSFEVALRDVEKPQRIFLHPKDSRVFVTVHPSSLRLWSIPRISKEIAPGGILFPDRAQLQRCCSTVLLPKGGNGSREGALQIWDVAFSVDASCLLALTDSLLVWKVSTDSSGLTGLQLVQQLAMETDEDFCDVPQILRFVGTPQVQAIVLASPSGCDLRVYRFSSTSSSPVGPLLQLVRLASAGSNAAARLEVDNTAYQTLTASFENRNCFIVLPLVKGWSTSSRIAFPFAQRFGATAPSSHHALMTARSLQRTIKNLFLYRAARDESKDGKWTVVVHQLAESLLRPEEAKLKNATGSSSVDPRVEELSPPEVSPRIEPSHKNLHVNGHGGAEEAEPFGDEPETLAASSSQRHEVDWRFVRQIAASYARGLDKRKGELAEKIVSEVVKSQVGKSGVSDLEVLNQVLAKVKDVREAQAVSEKNLQAAVQQAADAWAETSATSMSTLVSKEFEQMSDEVAFVLAKELSQSRKFCEALARGVQKSGAAATKQALEVLRPPEIQESLGHALSEALEETLTPVFKTELRSHFEQDLGPLIGLRVTEMLSVFRERMTECLQGIAAEHEQAAQRLGRDLAPLVADELKQVRHLMQTSSSQSGSLSEAQLDELTSSIEVEVIEPLHARVKELTVQVKALRAEAEQLQRRSEGKSHGPEAEAAQARDIQKLFREGRAEDAFQLALQKQGEARYQDFLEPLCSLVQPDQWLMEDPTGMALSPQVKIKLMQTLAQQCANCEETVLLSKVEWIQELWLALDLGEPAVEKQGKRLVTELIEALNRVQGHAGEQVQVRKLKRTLTQAVRMMTRE